MTWPNDTGADFEHWNEKVLWSIDEAAAIMHGLDPRIFISESKDPLTRKGPKAAINDFPKCRRMIADLVRLSRANDIKHIEDIDEPEIPMFWCIYPEEIRSRFPEFFNDRKPAIGVPMANSAKHKTKLLSELESARAKWWDNYDSTDSTTAPRNEEVANWLIARGVSKTIANSMATILRADGLPTGPR